MSNAQTSKGKVKQHKDKPYPLTIKLFRLETKKRKALFKKLRNTDDTYSCEDRESDSLAASRVVEIFSDYEHSIVDPPHSLKIMYEVYAALILRLLRI